MIEQTVVGHLCHVPAEFVIFFLQEAEEFRNVPRPPPSKPGNILHQYHVRLRLDEFAHIQQQVVSRVLAPVFRRERAEDLTGRAPGQQRRALAT